MIRILVNYNLEKLGLLTHCLAQKRVDPALLVVRAIQFFPVTDTY